jgi:hypothetical protein
VGVRREGSTPRNIVPNASKQDVMSYVQREQAEKQLEVEANALLALRR